MIRALLISTCLGAYFAACAYSDLDLAGKRCDAASGCPGDLICVEVPDSPTSRVGTCSDPAAAPTCQVGQVRCAAAGGWLEACEADGHSWRVDRECASPTACNPDTLACALSCAADADCDGDQTCDLGIDLCRPLPECEDASCAGLCVGDVCVPTAPGDATGASGAPELDCFPDPPLQPPASPSLCTLTGRVNLFPAKDNSDQALGLTVKLLEAAPPFAELDQALVAAEADGFGYYTFEGVETNARYLLQVQAGTSEAGIEVVTTLNAPVDLRADSCQAQTATVGISAMPAQTYQTYTAETIEGLDDARAMVIGRVLDCHADPRRPIGNVTVALGVPPPSPGRLYFFPDQTFLIPDLALAATSVKGYYAAVGVPATRNQIAFATRQANSDLALGAVDFFLHPGSAAIIDLPLPDQRLPE